MLEAVMALDHELHPLIRVIPTRVPAGTAEARASATDPLLEILCVGPLAEPAGGGPMVAHLLVRGELCVYTVGEAGPILEDLADACDELDLDLSEVTHL